MDGVNASAEASLTTPYTCQCCLIAERTKPMRPMSQVNDTAMRRSAYWLLPGMRPHLNSVLSAPLSMKASITRHATMTNRVVATCGTDDATLYSVFLKYP